jgi:outer membrane protein assembly factor BamB
VRLIFGFLGVCAFACHLSLASAGDSWPEFRGPTGQGHTDAQGLPLTWSEEQNVSWKTPLPGKGWSSPVIADKQIWMTTAVDDGQSLRAICVHEDTGELLHDVEVFRQASLPALHSKNSYASPTPLIEGDRVYVHFGTLGTACLSTETAEVLWTNQEFKLDHEVGPGSSPALFGDKLILTCDGIDVQFVAALEKNTGHVAWKTDRSGEPNDSPSQRKAFATPLLADFGQGHQIISPGAEQVVAYDVETGKELWKVKYPGFSNVPRPILGNDLIFVCTGFMKPEIWAIRPGGTGDVSSSHVQWKVTSQAPANPSPLWINDAVYMVSDQGVASCLSATTGEEIWQKRIGGNYSASPLAADGRIYFFSEEGETNVLKPGREFELLATNKLEGSIMASPAVAGRALFIRTDTQLYRIEEAATAAAAK